MRGWGRFFGRDSTVDRDDDHRHDSWSVFRGGARLDWEVGDRTTFMAQGEGYTTPELEQSRRVPAGVVFGEGEARGGHGLLRLEHRGGAAETRNQRNLSIQAYYDFEDRENVLDFEQESHTVDLDLRQHLVLGSRHEILWGAGYRYRRTDTSGVPTLRLSPSDEDSDLVTFSDQSGRQM